jgi:hypothetical protein
MPFEIQREVVSFVIASSNYFIAFPYPFHTFGFLAVSFLHTVISIFILQLSQYRAQSCALSVCEHCNWIARHNTRTHNTQHTHTHRLIMFFLFQTFALFWMLHSFFWMIPRCLNFMYRRFGIPCLFHLYRWCKHTFLLIPPMKKELILAKRRDIKFGRRIIVQKKEYNLKFVKLTRFKKRHLSN